MRIALVCPYDMTVPGGVQGVVADLAERLNRTGDDAFVVAPGATPPGIDVGRSIRVPGNGSEAPIAIWPGTGSRTRAAISSADVVHVHEPMMPIVSLAALRAGLPTVATFHAAGSDRVARLYRALEGLGSRLLGRARLSAVSPSAMAGLPDTWSPITIVPNAVDVGSFRLDTERAAHRVVAVGRDEPRKGLDVLVAAWPAIRERCPDAELHVIGADRGTGEGIVWHGRVDDRRKRELLAGSSVYVAPHLGGESFGIVLAEAMAAGCAVVGSDLPAFRAVLGEAGHLVEPGDAEALATGVAGVLSDPERRERLQRAGSTRVERYDWDVVLDGYRGLYEAAANPAN